MSINRLLFIFLGLAVGLGACKKETKLIKELPISARYFSPIDSIYGTYLVTGYQDQFPSNNYQISTYTISITKRSDSSIIGYQTGTYYYIKPSRGALGLSQYNFSGPSNYGPCPSDVIIQFSCNGIDSIYIGSNNRGCDSYNHGVWFNTYLVGPKIHN